MKSRNTLPKCHVKRRFFLPMAWWLAWMCLSLPDAASASDWMFQRSYFSHVGRDDEASRAIHPRSRSAYRPSVTGFGPGFAIRGGYRFKNLFLRSGNSTDTTVIRENFFDVTP